jgi:glycosyltransferase involved in cell wall biosynthesis
MNPAVPLLLLPGSFRIEKGHRYFLEALALLRDRGITVQAAFISTGALLDEITRRTHELRLEERVNFLGVLPSKVDVVTLMSLSDLVVLPSTHEGYPISAIEAMGAGAAVIASAVGGLVELIEHGVTGRLVPPRDSTALAEAIEQLLANDIERRLLGERAVEFVRTRHQADVVAELHEAVYRRMLEARDRPTLP